jgi:hypothetical protein
VCVVCGMEERRLLTWLQSCSSGVGACWVNQMQQERMPLMCRRSLHNNYAQAGEVAAVWQCTCL